MLEYIGICVLINVVFMSLLVLTGSEKNVESRTDREIQILEEEKKKARLSK